MVILKMDELKQFLIQHERYDLLAILCTFLDEVDYSSDDGDYEPPDSINEPMEEYINGSLLPEEDYEVLIDENGFQQII
jgi:hypothetical protein